MQVQISLQMWQVVENNSTVMCIHVSTTLNLCAQEEGSEVTNRIITALFMQHKFELVIGSEHNNVDNRHSIMNDQQQVDDRGGQCKINDGKPAHFKSRELKLCAISQLDLLARL